ncbi:MAG: tRNA pseudouridine(38-40) synthase TruA [Bacteroidales bacterium]|jgi:tRNA pseudouridine38-40 synthase|nr:tRNA pseudouridine(38-40) synthase TruA [Bacteroidales bacterium]
MTDQLVLYRYFVELAYNGAPFCGWQIQNNAVTVQSTLEDAFSRIMREPVALTGAGRTDTGVHAKKYVAHFDTSQHWNENDCEELCRKLNSYLREFIVVYKIYSVPNNLHARFSAISRTYQYFVSLEKNPFTFDFSYQLHGDLDINLMNEACKILHKYTDFSCFSKAHTQTKTNLCTIQKAMWKREKNDLVFTIQANRFLRNMVRAIVGTMIEVGQHKISLDDFRQIIESKNRCEAGLSVPAKGLFLTDVAYPLER